MNSIDYEKMPVSVHAGGGWEGHVFLVIRKSTGKKNSNLYDGIEGEFELFGSAQKKEVLSIVTKKLVYVKDSGLVIPISEIDENLPISSASKYLDAVNKELFDYFTKNSSLIK